jgi:hypothetical protein
MRSTTHPLVLAVRTEHPAWSIDPAKLSVGTEALGWTAQRAVPAPEMIWANTITRLAQMLTFLDAHAGEERFLAR